jgi:hypothetical protein
MLDRGASIGLFKLEELCALSALPWGGELGEQTSAGHLSRRSRDDQRLERKAMP